MPENTNSNEVALQLKIEYEKIPAWISAIEDSVHQIFTDCGEFVPRKSKRFLLSINHYKDEIHKVFRDNSFDESVFLENLNAISDRSRSLVATVREGDANPRLQDYVISLNALIQKKVKTLIEKRTYLIGSASNLSQEDVQKIAAAVEILKVQLLGHQQENNRLRKLVAESQQKAEQLNEKISTYDQRLSATFEASSSRADTIINELLAKQIEVNELAGIVSADTVARSYAKSAEVEKKFADSMRNGSVLLMLAIALLIGYSLLETARPHFDWEVALFRLVFSLALSVPAAYLARESAKHRAQQYSHLRVSLDLQAVTPYLASLPSEEQHRLKIEMANRIFGAKEASTNAVESYPLNIQELIMTLLSKIEVPKAAGKPTE